MRKCLATSIALAAACAPIPAAPPDPPAQEPPVVTANPGVDPLKGAAAGAYVCLVGGLWIFPPACGVAVLVGALVGAAKASGQPSARVSQ
ncbi:MAG: hypothetical protein ACREUO_05415 [Burkholderiales bacterium]